jgi:hypothetical protein
LTVPEAAGVLDIRPEAVRTRIARGHLQKYVRVRGIMKG